MSRSIAVAVFHENLIYRRGVVLTLNDDPVLRVVSDQHDVCATRREGSGDNRNPVWDVLVCSETLLPPISAGRPVVVLPQSHYVNSSLRVRRDIVAILPRTSLTADRLIDTVRAAASGLEVTQARTSFEVPERQLEVLTRLSNGDGTRQISVDLGYSERTIKQAISDAQQALGARNRCQVVATALRRDLI